MATVRDILETVWVIRGAEKATSDLANAAKAIQENARATDGSVDSTVAFSNVISALGGPMAVAIRVLGALTLGLSELAQEFAAATNQFAQDQQDIFRTTIVLQNMKSSLPIAELQAFSNELQRHVAIDDEAVVALGGLLARFNLTGLEITRAIGPIVDASKATGRSIDDIGTAIGRALQTGRTQGLVGLSDQFKKTGDQARDLDFILDQLNRRFAGAGEAQRGTLAGQVQSLSESFANLQSTIAQQAAPGFGQALDLLNDQIVTFGKNLDFLFGVFRVGSAALGVDLLPPAGNPAEGIGRGGGSVAERTEENTRQTAQNTARTADALVRQIVGGGAIGAAALNIRALNQAIRSVR